ncbi:MAG TPA: hypothetical protein VN457_03210 [Chlamydiales bacterium]|jgi:hypothetical protein|nr:hypothetical protein [Chlamydiales bacterium]
MQPSQQQPWGRFHNVVLLDTTVTVINDINKFACTISNPVAVKTKSRKSKRKKSFNDMANMTNKSKKKKTPSLK